MTASTSKTPPAAVVRASAPAKVNLYLHVVGRRTDGYHRLDSLIAFARVHDTVTVRPADALRLRVTGPFAAALKDDDNLVVRAARTLAKAAGVREGAEIELEKRLPVAAGMGGGSTDAAAALRALDRLWRLAMPPAALHDIALRLGADVPMCLAGTAAWVGGIGERLQPAPPLPPLPMVLVNPGVPLATPEVFRARGGAFSRPAPRPAHFDTPETLLSFLGSTGNDLAAGAERLCHAVGGVLHSLGRSEGCRLSRMTGSGATCFGVFSSAAAATAAAAALNRQQPGWWVRPTTLIRDLRELDLADPLAKNGSDRPAR